MLCSLAGRLPAISDKHQCQFSAVGLHKTMPSPVSDYSQICNPRSTLHWFEMQQCKHLSFRLLESAHQTFLVEVVLKTKKETFARQQPPSDAASGFAKAYSRHGSLSLPKVGIQYFPNTPTVGQRHSPGSRGASQSPFPIPPTPARSLSIALTLP